MARRSSAKGFSERKIPYRGPRSAARTVVGNAPGKRALPAPETLPDGTVRYFLVLGPKGRVLLPGEMRKAMGLQEGDVIVAWLKDGEVRMHSHVHGLRKIRADATAMTRGARYASDELVAERRAEAAKDDEGAVRWRRDRKRKR